MDKELLNSKKNEITKIFEKAQNRLVFQSSDLSFESIANMVEAGAIDIEPKYQRRERWDVKKQSALIESFVLNVPIPPIYLAEDEYGRYSVIDGKQRITAIYKFIKKSLKVEQLEKCEELNHFTYALLPPALKNALQIRPFLRVIILLKQSDPSLKYEVFNRLNTGGDNLLPQEIRNSLYEGEFNDLLMGLSQNSFLRNQLVSASNYEKSTIYKEMQDVEYVLRFFTIKQLWNSFPTNNMQLAMNEFMDKYRNTIDIEQAKTLFNQSIESANLIWGDQAFKRPEGSSKLIQGIYDAQMVSLGILISEGYFDLINNKTTEISQAFLNLYHSDEEYQNSMRQFTSNAKNIKLRISKTVQLIREVIEL
ncbi:DUF262 domain-containing protein [Acinetobacter seifertii]|nr:DUF262 domain-containing protein [Acinetobacter seifertii]